jgi:hypothetical protein
MMNFKSLLTSGYWLNTNSGTKYEVAYLAFACLVVLLAFGFRLYIFIKKNRVPLLKKYDRIWVWGGVTFALWFLFIWFSRTQALPIFSTRVIMVISLLVFFSSAGWFFFYSKKKAKALTKEFYTAKRKQKYLAKK